MIAAFDKGDVDHGPASSTPRCSSRTTSRPATSRPNPLPTKAMLRALGPAGRRSAGCRWARRPTGSRTAPAKCSPSSGSRAAWPTPVTITFLGGLGEIGRNCACIEVDGRIMLLDCGLMFPDADMLGIDLVLPDFTYLRENADRIEGCIVTHGHEDHAGGLSFLLRELSFPIYGSALTLGLARNRIEEAGCSTAPS